MHNRLAFRIEKNRLSLMSRRYLILVKLPSSFLRLPLLCCLRMEGAGGFVSTIRDMHRWYLTLSRRAILNTDSWETVFQPNVKENKVSHYGYGWAITTGENGEQLITHDGSNGYSCARFSYYPEKDVFVFIATNDIDNYPDDLMEELSRIATAVVNP